MGEWDSDVIACQREPRAYSVIPHPRLEKCNQTDCVWAAPGKVVVSVLLYLKVHLHIPLDDAKTRPPG